LGILSGVISKVEQTEVSEKLQKVWDVMDPEQKMRFPDAILYLQKSLNLRNYRTQIDLPKTKIERVKLIKELRQNDAVFHLFNFTFGVLAPTFKEIIVVGQGYNVFLDSPLSASPFELRQLQTSDIGYQFPSMIKCNVDPTNVDIVKFFKNFPDYLEERLKSLDRVSKVSEDTFKAVVKAGCNVLNTITTSTGEIVAPITAVREFQTFQLVLNDKFS